MIKEKIFNKKKLQFDIFDLKFKKGNHVKLKFKKKK